MDARFCLSCGTQLQRKQFPTGWESWPRFAKRKYCDKRCMAAGMVKDAPTEAAYRWRARQHRAAKCEKCGSRDRLHAHHRDGDLSNNAPENIATLCASCHLRWHWRNGKANPPRKVCSICGQPARKLGLCSKHYQRARKYGDPRLTKRKVGQHGFALVRE